MEYRDEWEHRAEKDATQLCAYLTTWQHCLHAGKAIRASTEATLRLNARRNVETAIRRRTEGAVRP